MTIYLAGCEVGTFTPQTSEETDTPSVFAYDSSFARGVMLARTGVSGLVGTIWAESVDVALPDDFWLHVDIAKRSSTASAITVMTLRTSTTDVVRFQLTDTTIQMQALISSVWTNVGSAVSANFVQDTEQTIDVHIVGNSGTGTMTLYMSGTERTTGTADLTAVTGIENVRLYDAVVGSVISQLIIADENTSGWRLMTCPPTGAGATVDWTGDYTAVDEIPYSDADFIYSGTANQVEMATVTPQSTITGYTIRGVAVYCRARKGASGPANLQLAVRAGSTNYFSGSKALGTGFDGFGHIWEQNPDSAADWTAAQITSLQIGVKSIT